MTNTTTRSQEDISVIIPFKDKSEMTLACVKSLLTYGPDVKEILLISNNSSDEEVENIKQGIRDIPAAKLHIYDHPFNYQKINNWAVKKSSGHFILFLNNDTELVPNSAGLIEDMCKMASKPDVGIAGCLLLFGDEMTIQHAGVFLVPGGQADHLYVTKKYITAKKNAGSDEFPYDVEEDRQLTAVTGAVNVLERKKFDAVDGFDERFIIGGGDVDLCLRLSEKGFSTWYVGGKSGYILHKESQSRKFIPIPYSDFYWSYKSYFKGFSLSEGDPLLSKITNKRA